MLLLWCSRLFLCSFYGVLGIYAVSMQLLWCFRLLLWCSGLLLCGYYSVLSVLGGFCAVSMVFWVFKVVSMQLLWCSRLLLCSFDGVLIFLGCFYAVAMVF